jgi:predicted DNA-binding protein (MmcQ/YjbR family)
MFVDELREYCLSKPFSEECFPFDEDTLVFKVMGKMFALVSLSEPDTVNLKCDPAYAIELREQYNEVQPGYHMSKKHWNTVALQGTLADSFLHSLIDHSYEQVLKSLPKKTRRVLGFDS